MEAILEAIGSSGAATFLRSSEYLYPLVNTAHILGFALLVGSIAALDARILGFGKAIALADAARLLLPFTIGGLLVAVFTGVALFSVKPEEYAANPVFLAKLGLIVLALANALSLRLRPVWRTALAGGAVAPGLRISAILSLVFWLGVLTAGRMIAFFGY
ncbi:MAG TPA: DUF2214 domain-containing protein [Bauldia sp.]|nr:DUF2214 domain-containing protein [Bauldia sp.]